MHKVAAVLEEHFIKSLLKNFESCCYHRAPRRKYPRDSENNLRDTFICFMTSKYELSIFRKIICETRQQKSTWNHVMPWTISRA